MAVFGRNGWNEDQYTGKASVQKPREEKKSPGNIEYYTNITHMRACAAGTNVKGDCVFVWRLFEGLHG